MPEPFDVELSRLTRLLRTGRPGLELEESFRLLSTLAAADNAARHSNAPGPVVDSRSLADALDAVAADARLGGVDLEKFADEAVTARHAAARA